jgi:hypothetical protein
MTSEPTIDYEALAQEAMRGVVRTILARTAKSGLPGDHHFYISFDTEGAGVTLSKRLREKYPREMTIVLQHRFWDLAVTDDRFEVKLTFDGIPERLVIPFAAIKVFFDPSVRYGLQFEDPSLGPDTTTQAMNGLDNEARATVRSAAQRKSRSGKKTRTERDGFPQAPQEAQPAEAPAKPATPASVAASAASSKGAPAQSTPTKPAHDRPANSGGAEIVSLDKFRKK